MKRREFLSSAAALTTLAISSGFGERPAFAQTEKVFKWVPFSDLAVLDPIFTTQTTTAHFGQIVYDTLFAVDENFDPKPQMAESFTKSDDGLIWTITLREGLKFHDGSVVSSQDVVASIQRWATRDPMGTLLFERVKSFTASDPRTVKFELKEPFPLLPNALGRQMGNMAVIAPAALAATPSNRQITTINGSGPFSFSADEWVPGSRAVFKKFAGYKPRPDETGSSYTSGPKMALIDRLEWITIPDSATAVAALQAGEVDGLDTVDVNFLPLLEADQNIALVRDRIPRLDIMLFNQLHPPFNSSAFRRAILSAVDQSTFMIAHHGQGAESNWSAGVGILAPGNRYATDSGLEAVKAPRDLSAAKKAVESAGYDGEEIVILDAADVSNLHTYALITEQLLKQLGLNTKLQTLDWGTIIQRRNSQAPGSAGGWNVALTSIPPAGAVDPLSNNALRGNGTRGWIGWPTSEGIERLRIEFLNAPTDDKRKEVAGRLQQTFFQDVPYIPLGASFKFSAYAKKWKGMSNISPVFYNVHQ